MSVDRSTLKKSRHIWLGDFIVHSSMVHADSYLVAALSYTYLTAIYYTHHTVRQISAFMSATVALHISRKLPNLL
jgi:hypothetical protein